MTDSTDLQETSYATFREVFTNPRLSVRKRAVPALAAFVGVCPQWFSQVQADMAKGFSKGGDSAKAWVAAVSGMAKTSIASEIAILIMEENLVDDVLAQTDDLEDCDAVEGALTV